MPPRSRKFRPSLLAATALAAMAFVGGVAAQAAPASASTPVVPSRASSPAATLASGVPRPAATVADHGGPRWNELSASQRHILAPLAADWNNGIDSRSKERWMDVAARFHKLPPEEQQRATQRMVEWAHMSVAQRTQARANYQALRNVSPAEREARWKAYQALPEEKKRELAKRAAAPASAASGTLAARRHVPPPLGTVQPKTNVVGHAPAGSAPLLATPIRPGATTPLLTRRATPPAHQRDGQPKIAAGPNAVDRTTLLPKRPPSGATVSAAASTASAHR
ncbi:MAG: DUF3106 domain-containing protein [Burkholderiaceae bacterium]